MKENPFDRRMDKLLDYTNHISDKMDKEFKGMKPFDKEVISDEDMYKSYKMLTPTDMAFLIQKHSYEEVNEFVREMESYPMRRMVQ